MVLEASVAFDLKKKVVLIKSTWMFTCTHSLHYRIMKLLQVTHPAKSLEVYLVTLRRL